MSNSDSERSLREDSVHVGTHHGQADVHQDGHQAELEGHEKDSDDEHERVEQDRRREPPDNVVGGEPNENNPQPSGHVVVGNVSLKT